MQPKWVSELRNRRRSGGRGEGEKRRRQQGLRWQGQK